ncbi:MAG TPA: ribonuclease HI family protein [Ktedonobacterales bacterium]
MSGRKLRGGLRMGVQYGAMGEHPQVEERRALPYLILRTDGASRGNPGHSAAGIVLESPDGTVLATGKLYLGVMTNNQAEYRALILGLKSVAHFHPAQVRVFMDSDLIVNQMRGTYKVRHPDLEPLWREACALVKALPSVTFDHVPRAQNALADKLANEALNARTER